MGEVVLLWCHNSSLYFRIASVDTQFKKKKKGKSADSRGSKSWTSHFRGVRSTGCLDAFICHWGILQQTGLLRVPVAVWRHYVNCIVGDFDFFFFYLCPPVPFSCRGFCRVQSDAFLCLPVIISEHEITQLKAVNQHWGPRENYYAFKLWIILKILSLRTKRRL